MRRQHVPTATVALVHGLILHAASRGVPPPAFIARFGLDPAVLADVDGRLPLPVIGRIWDEIGELCGDPDTPLHAAAALNARDDDAPLVALLFFASPTLGVGFHRFLRFERVHHGESVMELSVDGGAVEVTCVPERTAFPPPPPVVLFGLACLLRLAQIATGREINGYPVLGPDFNHDGYADLAVGVPDEDLIAGVDHGEVNIFYGSASGLSTTNQPLHRDWLGVEDVAGESDRFGYSIAYGDFNGDCYTDLAVGVPYDDVGSVIDAGSVHVFYGSVTGLSTSTDEVWTQFWLDGSLSGNARFGLTLAVGNFDGDAYDDLVVGAPNEGMGVLQNVGKVFVVHGSGNGLNSGRSQAWAQGPSWGIPGTAAANELFGSALAAGDFNGDGRDDLAIGVPNETVNGALRAGSVHILYGKLLSGLSSANNQLLREGIGGIPGVPAAGDSFGFALAAGNFDDNGGDDLAIGAPGQEVNGHPGAGKITAIYSDASGLDLTTSQIWTQEKPGIDGIAEDDENFGYSLIAADFNGFGYDDVAVGVPNDRVDGHTHAGAVNLIPGSASGLTDAGSSRWTQESGNASAYILDTAEDGDLFGYALAAGDYDGDHFFDLAVAVPEEDLSNLLDMGAVNVIYGSPMGLTCTDNQLLFQPSAGITDPGEMGDRFGLGL